MDRSSSQQTSSPLWTVNFILICISSLALSFTFKSLNIALPVYIESIGGATSAAGFPLAALTIGAVIIRPLTGWALDTYGRPLIFFAGLSLFFVSSLVYIWMMPIFFLIAIRFIQGLGWGVSNTALNTVATDNIPRERMGEGMGFFFLALSITMAVAPSLSLWVLDNFSFRILFIICSLFIFCSMILSLIIRYPQFKKQTGQAMPVFLEKAALFPSLVTFFISIAQSSTLSFLILYAMQQGLATAGSFFIAMSFSTMVTRPLSGILTDRWGNSGYHLLFVFGSAAILIAMPIIALTSSLIHLIAGGILNGICLGFIQPTMLTLCVRSAHPGKIGAANATFWTAVDIGIATGSIVWGFVANALGYKLMFNLTVLPVIVAILIYFLGKSRMSVEANIFSLQDNARY